jgi:TDG/mug DNA glycosylase family protein
MAGGPGMSSSVTNRSLTMDFLAFSGRYATVAHGIRHTLDTQDWQAHPHHIGHTPRSVDKPAPVRGCGPVARFTRAELESFRGAAVPDLLGPNVRLLFVGINPGLWTAATQTHFAHPVNRFYPALLRAGVIDRRIDPSAGMTDDDRAYLVARGIGITNLVEHATARASELSSADIRAGAARLESLVARVRPRVVAVAGVTAYRVAFARPKATLGRQPDSIAGAELWAVPNPSGLNAHETIDSLSLAYAEPARAAGIV